MVVHSNSAMLCNSHLEGPKLQVRLDNRILETENDNGIYIYIYRLDLFDLKSKFLYIYR